MNRDLGFWKYNHAISLQNKEVYTKLLIGEFVEGVADLPTADILQNIEDTLKEWSKFDEIHFEKGEEMIELFTTSQFIRFSCYQVSEQHMNALIDLMLRYECPLYDAAIEVRFEVE